MPSSNIKRKKKPVSNNATNGSNFTETAMDEFLARLNLYRKPIAKDGSCLFRAVSEQVYNCQAKHLQVRKDCIDFMRRNRDKFEAFLEGPFDHHLFRLQNPKEWAGQVEISALSLMYKKDFVVYQDINAEPTKVTDNNFKDKILLCYSNGNHYDAVYNIQFQKDAALCQSMVYEILYQRVFSELDRKENLRGSKHNQSTDMNSMMALYQNGLGEDDSFKEDSEDNSGWTEVVRGRSNKAKSARQNRGYEQEEMKDEAAKPSLDQKHGWQAKRSLDTELYRNVELEVWEDSKNGQEQQDRSYAASIQYQPGDKCFAWLGQPDVADKVYEAIVVFNLPIQGNIEVKVPELHNKSFVIPLENLKPSDSQQDLHYRELSGYYKKSESAAGGDGSREDGKRGGRRRNLPPRPPRGVKGDEQGEDGPARKGFQDEPFGRTRGGPGSRDKFGRGRGRGRYPRGRDERQLHREDEDAKLIAQEQAKLAELQEKDPAAFPALPTQLVEEKPLSSTEAAPDQSPAEFWSRLKNTQGKPVTTPPKELNQAGASTDDKLPSPLTNHQLHTAKLEEKGLETRKEKPLTKEPKVPVPETSETGNKEGEAVKKIDVQSPETNSSRVALESSKTEKSEAVKPVMSPEKDLVKDKMEVSKGALLNESKQPVTAPSTELKVTVQKPTTEEVKLVDVSEARTAWSKEMLERKEPKPQESSVKEHEMETKKTEEQPPVKPGVRGLIRMTNLNNKPQQASETKDQVETHKDDVKLVRKEDTPSLKSALAGEGPTSVPEKKTVTFAEPLNEGGEIKVLLNTAKDLAGKDGKREILAPPTLVSVVMKPAPASEISAQQENPSISILAPSKNTPEDETTTTQSSIPNNHASAKSQTSSSTPTDTNQSSEEAQPAPSSSPTVSQHQASYSLPILTYLFSHVPNMTSQPRMPQGISVESDGSDLPEDPNTLRYFFNLGFSYHMQLCQQQWANQQMIFYPPMYPVPSQDHLQPHSAVSMGQQLSPGVPQMMYPTQQLQTYHPAQVPPVMQENTSFSDRSSMDRNSSGQTQQQQQHQTPPFMNQHPPHHAPWRNARSMTGYQSKQMHLGGYNSQVQNQQTPRGPMQQGAGNNKPHFKQKKYPKHRNDQYLYNAQSQHTQNQGPMGQGAHAYSNAPQTAGSSSNAFYMASGDHSASKSSGDYYHGPQQFSNFHSNVSSNLSQGPHSTAANLRAQYP